MVHGDRATTRGEPVVDARSPHDPAQEHRGHEGRQVQGHQYQSDRWSFHRTDPHLFNAPPARSLLPGLAPPDLVPRCGTGHAVGTVETHRRRMHAQRADPTLTPLTPNASPVLRMPMAGLGINSRLRLDHGGQNRMMTGTPPGSVTQANSRNCGSSPVMVAWRTPVSWKIVAPGPWVDHSSPRCHFAVPLITQ